LFAGGQILLPGYDVFSSVTVDIYNSSSGTWSTTNLMQLCLNLAAASVGDLVLFGGGLFQYQPFQTLAVVDIHNHTCNCWNVTSLHQPRELLAAVSIKDLTLFAGGNDDNSIFITMDIYNSMLNTWTIRTLSHACTAFQAFAVVGEALFLGGCTSYLLLVQQIRMFCS
jgi:hypothetical protein